MKVSPGDRIVLSHDGAGLYEHWASGVTGKARAVGRLNTDYEAKGGDRGTVTSWAQGYSANGPSEHMSDMWWVVFDKHGPRSLAIKQQQFTVLNALDLMLEALR